MFSRVTLLEIDTLRVDVDAVLEAYREEVLPELRRQPGYGGVVVMVNPEGQGMVITLWASEEAMAATTPIASAALERFVTIFRAPPGREQYEVRLVELPALAPG
jgi:hypothetical protein